MKLSGLQNLFDDFVVINDCEFNSLGMATTEFKSSGVLSFLVDEKFTKSVLENINISAIITTNELLPNFLNLGKGIVVSSNPKKKFYEIHNYLVDHNFYWSPFVTTIDKSSQISEHSIISKSSVKIGSNCVIQEGVIIHPGVIIGDNVIIRSGSILGGFGFQFLNDDDKMYSVKTGGMLKIGNDVEIQHNCCVERGVLGGTTTICDYAKIDNFVHIAHDCVIGERTLITAGVKFGGRTVVGKDCWIGINSTISNGLKIGDNSTISLGSVVTRDVPSGMTVTGNFAIEHSKFLAFLKSIR